MSRWQRKSLVLMLVLSLLALVGCGGAPTPSPQPAPAAQSQPPAQPEPAEFHFAMSGLYRPFNFQKDGQLTGFDVEIGMAIAERMGMKGVPVTNPWETILQGLRSAKYDAIIGSMAITEKRAEVVNFSRPYYRSGAQVFVAANNDTIAGPQDLRGKKIGVVKASTFRDIAVELTAEDNVIGYDSDVIALQDLPTGRLDAVITDQIVGIMAINEAGLAIKDVGAPLFVDEMAIPVRKEDTELLAKINQALAEIIADGTYQQISEKWFGRSILGE